MKTMTRIPANAATTRTSVPVSGKHTGKAVCFFLALAAAAATAHAALVNVALNKPASANSVWEGGGAYPSGAVDGDVGNRWVAMGHGTSSAPIWLAVDLLQSHDIEQIILTFATNGVPGYTNIYNLYKGSNASDWTLIGSGTLVDTYDHRHVLDFAGESMRYIKYEVVGGTHWANLTEMEAFAMIPEPGVFGLLPLAALLMRRRRSE
jgi:hypothetical protein